MYAENWLQGRRWADFEACGASSLPPAAGEDRARTDAGRCAAAEHEGQGVKVGVPAAPPIPEGRPLPPPGTPERARLGHAAHAPDFPHDRRGGFPVAGWFERAFPNPAFAGPARPAVLAGYGREHGRRGMCSGMMDFEKPVAYGGAVAAI